ncbi:glycoside hydrolase family 5 protein [Leadbettera azotonutricia]|uniref:Putative cellulase (Glycosyl hydrolase family 5) n=1 Tax=Leadbettera azotonutricia (strain ATCC BAA-888 / DSM 13862 / ZAS-9) TaxID=545695 RepID=F5Y775_LEAAZ|nr:cellulase family glycosylhydrolase [Leadbettera azotonutricia]AEF83159.1 putative cellulase (glycosyl hydrolase family 5) [Leadbettera azotonutricia ZAS-9]
MLQEDTVASIDDLKQLSVFTESTAKIVCPLDEADFDGTTDILTISYHYTGKGGEGDANNTIKISLLNKQKGQIKKDIFTFRNNDTLDTNTEGIHEAIFTLSQEDIALMGYIEISIISRDGSTGVEKITVAFSNSTDEPDIQDPGTTDRQTDPGTTDPGTTDPGTTDPGTTDPGTTDPGTTDPGTTDPGTTDPGTTDPGTTDPGTTDPGTTDPGTTDPGTQEPDDNGAKYLRVNGNQIEYGRGGNFKSVVLRGVNVGDLYHFKRAANRSAPSFTRIANELNANVVRFAVPPGRLWHEERAQSIAYLKENVQKALDAGLFVIIDYHTVAVPDGGAEDLNNSWIGYTGDFNTAKDFWDTISREFSDGRILFELWNEPQNVYKNQASWTALKGYWEQLISIIRNNGRSNVLIASGFYWTLDLRSIKNSLLSDANTAYAWHVYGGHNGTPEIWENYLDGLYQIRPIVTTEWGYYTNPKSDLYDTPANFADKLVSQFFKAKNLHNLAWGYDPWYGPNMLLNENYNTLSDYGQYVVDYLRSNVQERP